MKTEFKSQTPGLFRSATAGVCGLLLNIGIISAPLMFFSVGDSDRRLVVLYVLSVAIFLADLPKFKSGSSGEQLPEFGRYQWMALAGSLLLLALQWAVLSEVLSPTNHDAGFPVAGLLIGLAGCVIRSIAVWTLGDAFRSGRSSSPIVTTGIYRFFRHPSELGLVFACAGLVLAGGAWTSGVFFFPFIIASSLMRVREEEGWLL